MDTFERVRRVVAKTLDVGEDEITLKTSLTGDLGADSLDMVQVVMALEEEFGQDVPDDDSISLTTVQQIVDYVEMPAPALR